LPCGQSLYRKKMYSYFVYILASGKDGTLYIGITNDLIRRVNEHKQGKIEGFTKRYKINRLVYFEETNNVKAAIEREKRIKGWKRVWKIELIESTNPKWCDLYDELIKE
jgi:putative endonuclease